MKKLLVSVLFVTGCMYGACSSKKGCCPSACPKTTTTDTKTQQTKEAIKQAYSQAAQSGGLCTLGGGCCGGGGDLSKTIGYTNEELGELADANLGLGCGHPINLGQIKEGDVVLDLGSGAGLDAFLASRRVGRSGKVIGIDMTDAMLEKARDNAKKYNINNVEFKKGDIEEMPIASNSIDVIISNCVINLAPHKDKVFKEAHRVLKAGGRMAISDVVLTAPLSDEQKNDTVLMCACVSGAMLKNDYIALLSRTGFDVQVIDEDLEIGQKWFGNNDLPISSLKFVAVKK